MSGLRGGGWRSSVLLALICGAAVSIAAADDMELLTTRTTPPQPSATLMQALELSVPEWEGDDTQPKISLPADDLRRADEAGLRALDALPASAMTSDFDRAWVAFARGRTLEALGRRDEAMAQYQRLRTMPRTNVLDRYALVHLYGLGDQSAPGWCAGAGPADKPMVWRADYPKAALDRRIEGWVDAIYDVDVGGAIKAVTVKQSSMRVFEQAAGEWLQRQQFKEPSGALPVRPCFGLLRQTYRIHKSASSRGPAFAVDAIPHEPEYTFRYIGPSLAIRREARQAIIAAKAQQSGGNR
jgi:hypothetical protein